MASEPLSEAEREALDAATALYGWATQDEAGEATHKAVEQIVAARTQALEAEVDRLKRGGKTLGKSLDYWMRLAQKVTGSDDVIEDDGDGDWGVVAERLTALGSRAEAAEAEVRRLRALLDGEAP